jgi:hypothetical protein
MVPADAVGRGASVQVRVFGREMLEFVAFGVLT